jgi:hypothetical protein
MAARSRLVDESCGRASELEVVPGVPKDPDQLLRHAGVIFDDEKSRHTISSLMGPASSAAWKSRRSTTAQHASRNEVAPSRFRHGMNRLFVFVLLGCGGPSPEPLDAGLRQACEAPERECPCLDGSRGLQVCFEPGGIWSQCGCEVPDPRADASVADGGQRDAGPQDAVDGGDAGRAGRDGGFPACPPAYTCNPLGMSGASACVMAGTGLPSCDDGGACDGLPGAMCRTLQGQSRCLRLCSP